MKRLSATQKEIEVLAKRVPLLTEEQRKWAEGKFEYYVHIRQGHTDAVCPNCKGHFNPYDMVGEKSRWNKHDKVYTCPHCGARIQVSVESDTYGKASHASRTQQDFFEVMNVVGGWQVTRLFYMERKVYVRKPNTDWEIWEVCQAWNHPNVAKTHFRAFAKKMMCTWYFNPYSLWDWQLRKDEEGNYLRDADGNYITDYFPRELEPRRPGSENYFDTNSIAPRAQILPQYRRMGLTLARMSKFSHNFLWLFEAFSADNYKPMYETLWKAREWEIFKHVTDSYYRGSADMVFSAWKVCKRNHYTQYKRHTQEWLDMLDMLAEEHLDYRNAHYVCPDDLMAWHDELVERREVRRERARRIAQAEREREIMERNKALVEERISKFGDLCISNGTLHSVVMITYDDYQSEGARMHHCVGGYFDKKTSLILSFRDSKGKRVETVEIDLKSFSIIQSRGACNKSTKHHNEIIDLVNANMGQIRKRMVA